MDGSNVRAPCALGMNDQEHSLFVYLCANKGLNKVIQKTAKKFSYAHKDREDDLVQALILEALEYCSKEKRLQETVWQSFYGLKTRLHGEAMRVSVNLSEAVNKPDGKKQRLSRRELQHGDEQTKVDPDRIYGNMTYLPSNDPDPNSRYSIDARYLQTNYLAHDRQNDRLLECIDLERVWLGLPFYTNCKLDKYERIYLLFDRLIAVEHASELLKIQRKTLQNWCDRTTDRYPYFDHRRKLSEKQHDEIARVKRKWMHVK